MPKKKRSREESTSTSTDSKNTGIDEVAPAKQLKLSDKHIFDPITQMKFISWNVNGFRAMYKRDSGKTVKDMIELEQPYALCLQETKLGEKPNKNDPDFKSLLKNYTYHFNTCKSKGGYAGTAIYTHKEYPPIKVTFDMGIKKHDQEGRLICAEYEDCYLINTYVPNSGQKLERLDYRTKEWDKDLFEYLKKLDKQKPIVWTGDLNVAILDIDVHSPKTNTKTAGFTKEERDSFRSFLEVGFTDTFRKFHPNEKDQYTYWGYRFKMREKNKGWRLDYFITSGRVDSLVKDSYILKDVLGSDHCPIGIILDKKSSNEKKEDKETK